MTEQKYIKGLSITVFSLVSLITIISFVLSYEALWSYALSGGKPETLAWLWPVIIDLPIIVFSVVSLFAVALGYNPWPFRGVVGLVTLGTVYFNYSYAVSEGLSWQVYITAPIMYFVSFEVLAWLIKVVSERSVILTKIAEISAKLGVLEIEYRGRVDNLKSEFERESGQLGEALTARQSELGQLQEEITAKTKALETYQQDIEAKREELKILDNGQAKVYVPANLDINQRRELVNRMSQEGMTIEAIAKALGCSPGTVKNDKVANKSVTSPEEIPGNYARNGNHGAAVKG